MPINLVIAFNAHHIAHAGEQNVGLQSDTAAIENPPLPRPKPPLNDLAADNPAVLISAFRHENGEGSVIISSTLNRIAQAQADVVAVHDSLDHKLAPFSSVVATSAARLRISLSVMLNFASILKQ